MRAVHFDGLRLSVKEDLPIPNVASDEVLVRVHLAGICSTDLEITKGYFGFRGVLGHEFVGSVDSASDTGWAGKRVVSSINFAPTGSSYPIHMELEHLPGREVLGILNRDGAMADWVAIPTRNLLAVPDNVSNDEAVFVEPLAAALRIAQQLPVNPRARIAVIGPGRLGMLVAGVLGLGGADIVLFGRTHASLELPKRWRIKTGLIEEADSCSFDMVVECTGNPVGFQHAVRMARPCGTIVLKSTYAEPKELDLTMVVVNELRIQGSRCGPFEPAIRLLERHAIDVRSLIDRIYPATHALDAFRMAQQPGIRKVLLRFSE